MKRLIINGLLIIGMLLATALVVWSTSFYFDTFVSGDMPMIYILMTGILQLVEYLLFIVIIVAVSKFLIKKQKTN